MRRSRSQKTEISNNAAERTVATSTAALSVRGPKICTITIGSASLLNLVPVMPRKSIIRDQPTHEQMTKAGARDKLEGTGKEPIKSSAVDRRHPFYPESIFSFQEAE